MWSRKFSNLATRGKTILRRICLNYYSKCGQITKFSESHCIARRCEKISVRELWKNDAKNQLIIRYNTCFSTRELSLYIHVIARAPSEILHTHRGYPSPSSWLKKWFFLHRPFLYTLLHPCATIFRYVFYELQQTDADIESTQSYRRRV